MPVQCRADQGGICQGGHVLVTEFRGMALNGLLCADVLLPLDLIPLSLTLPTNTTLGLIGSKFEERETQGRGKD